MQLGTVFSTYYIYNDLQSRACGFFMLLCFWCFLVGLAIQGRNVIVVGAGPSGLAVAAALVQKGEEVVLFERQANIQGGWRQHFDGLTITTRASTCSLPDFPLDICTCSDELLGEEYVEYLRAYAARFTLDVRCNTEVVGIDDVEGAWSVRVKSGGDVEGELVTWSCQEIVIATGKNAVPLVPQPWAEITASCIIHSSHLQGPCFREAVRAACAQELLVIGFGNSAADICKLILRDAGCDGAVHVSMRRLPPIVRRQWGPLRLEWFATLFSLVCDRNGDRLTSFLMYLIEGDFGSLFPDLPTWGARKERHIPTVDRDGALLQLVREKRIVPHQGVESVEVCTNGDSQKVQVKFAGEAKKHTFANVIVCTGYESSLQAQKECLSNDAVLARAHFVGLGPEPSDLLPLRGIGREAKKVAQHILDLLNLKRRHEERRSHFEDAVAKID